MRTSVVIAPNIGVFTYLSHFGLKGNFTSPHGGNSWYCKVKARYIFISKIFVFKASLNHVVKCQRSVQKTVKKRPVIIVNVYDMGWEITPVLFLAPCRVILLLNMIIIYNKYRTVHIPYCCFRVSK